jgi:hypothetical protein
MIESVNKQMFKQFTECVRSTLAQPAETPAASTAPVAEIGATSPTSSPPPLVSVIATPTSGSIIPASMGAASTPAPGTSTVSAQPVRLLPVLFRALGDYLLGLLSRLVGRKRGGRGPTP